MPREPGISVLRKRDGQVLKGRTCSGLFSTERLLDRRLLLFPASACPLAVTGGAAAGFLRDVRLRKMPASPPPPPLLELPVFLASTADLTTFGGAAAFFDAPAVRVAGGGPPASAVGAVAERRVAGTAPAGGVSVGERVAGIPGLVERLRPKASMEILRPIVRGGGTAIAVGAGAAFGAVGTGTIAGWLEGAETAASETQEEEALFSTGGVPAADPENRASSPGDDSAPFSSGEPDALGRRFSTLESGGVTGAEPGLSTFSPSSGPSRTGSDAAGGVAKRTSASPGASGVGGIIRNVGGEGGVDLSRPASGSSGGGSGRSARAEGGEAGGEGGRS